jgi:ABC-type phosphate transport system substrate-binding protein
MIRKVATVAGAVAAILAGNSAFALTPAQIAADIAGGTITIVNLTGSSAFRDELLVALSTVCDGSSNDAYGADASFNDPATTARNSWTGYGVAPGPYYSYNGPDFRGYSCHLKAGLSGALSTLSATDILVYYRSEGGSVYGVAPLALSAQIQRLDIPNPAAIPAGEAACVEGSATATQQNGFAFPAGLKNGFNEWICPVPTPLLNTSQKLGPGSAAGTPATGGWWLPYDNWVNTAANGGGLAVYAGPVDLVIDTPTMGVSDVEPTLLAGENYPTNNLTGDNTSLGSGLSTTQLGTIAATPVLQQIFGVIASSNAASLVTKNLTNISKQTVTGILSGKYTNWNQTPEGGGIAAPITICRRDPGSGTQTITSVFYLNVTCGKASPLESALASKKGNGALVQTYATTGDVQACVGSTPDAFGPSVFGGNPVGGHFLTVDGVAMSQPNVLNGTYKEWEEVNYVKGPQFTAATPAQQNLINGLITDTADTAGGVVAANSAYAYIPNQVDATPPDNAPSIANLAKFVNLVTRKGDSCQQEPQPLNTN